MIFLSVLELVHVDLLFVGVPVCLETFARRLVWNQRRTNKNFQEPSRNIVHSYGKNTPPPPHYGGLVRTQCRYSPIN